MPMIGSLGSSDWNLWPLTRDYDRLFEILSLHKIRNVELGIYQPSVELTSANQDVILKASGKHGITVTAMLFSLTPEFWPKGAFSNRSSHFLKEAEIFLDALQAMNIQYGNMWTGADLQGCDVSEVRLTLGALDQLGDGFDGVISIEYKAGTVFPNGMELAKFLSTTKKLRVLIDTGHAFALEEDIVELIGALNDRDLLGAIHLGDALPGDSDADLPCGRVNDFLPILQKLKNIGFQHSMNFDLYGASIDENGPGPLSILEESHNYILRELSNIQG